MLGDFLKIIWLIINEFKHFNKYSIIDLMIVLMTYKIYYYLEKLF